MSSPSQQSTPRILDRLPKALRRRLSLEELAHAVLSTDESFPLTVAIDRIQRYAATASKLSTAIKRDFAGEYRRGVAAPRALRRAGVPRANAFINIHFLFTCWWAARVGVKTIRRSANRLILPVVKQAIRPFDSELEHYAEGRSHFEHLEERLPGGQQESMMRPRVYGGLHNGEMFQFANDSWDVSVRSSERLKKLGSDLRSALIVDLLELGGRSEAEALRRYLGRLADTARTERVTRRVMKILAGGAATSPRRRRARPRAEAPAR